MTRPGAVARGDAGNAALEFLALGVLLLVPVVYLVLTVGRLQAAAMAADRAAVLGARALVAAPDEVEGRRAAAAALELGLRDHGFDPAAGELAVRCPRVCLTPGEPVEVTVSIRVGLPLVPAFLTGAVPAAVTVRADHAAPVDRFRATP